MAQRSALLTVMANAAEKAGKALVRDFGEVENLQVSRKGPADFVSNADTKAEKILREELSKARPRFGWLMEEGGEKASERGEPRWIVDPLDGTTNFLHGLPHWAISIALEDQGQVIAGVIFDPIKNEMFWAERGSGAFLNNRRIRVSGRKLLEDSILATGIPFKGLEDRHEPFLKQLKKAMIETSGIRRYGAASLDLAWVAAGRYDGFWEIGLHPWDVAAGIVLVREAGGGIFEIDGGNDPLYGDSILASNSLLGPTLKALFKSTL